MKLLLHCCCAPCSTAVIEHLVSEGIRPCLFFSNSNIVPSGEYRKRKDELVRFASAYGLEVVDDDYDHEDWLRCVFGMENEPERGRRCETCFHYRLRRAARYAAGHGFDTLATTLASSRWKDLDQVGRAGESACREEGTLRFWNCNWRKGGLQQRRSELIREWNLYEQDWCGCEFSRRKRVHPEIMGIVNLTPDSFWAPSRATAENALERMRTMASQGASILDVGAVSTRPGAEDVPLEQEWSRLEGVLKQLGPGLRGLGEPSGVRLSIDTTSAEIVRRTFETVGPFIVNDISAGEDDTRMLETVSQLDLDYIAMHKRGNPRTMDAMVRYPDGVVAEVCRYFEEFSRKASEIGIRRWILDPGFGFAKNEEQNMELLRSLKELGRIHRPMLIGIADKRFTHGRTEELHRVAIEGGADILRVHDVPAAAKTLGRG